MSIRYGYCTNFASSITGPIFFPLLEDILAAGYDYVEFPLMQTAALSDEAFTVLVRWLEHNGLAADCTCNMFPPSVRLTGAGSGPPRTVGDQEDRFGQLRSP